MRADSDIFCMAVWWTGAAGGLADELLFRLGERVDRRLKVLFVVRGAHLGPYPRSAVGDNRVEEADHVDALLQHPRREALREGGVAEHDGPTIAPWQLRRLPLSPSSRNCAGP